MSSKNKESSTNKNHHVVPEQGRWAVKAAGSTRAARVYDTQAEAIDAAKKATTKNGQVVVHGRDGRVRQTISKSRADELMMNVWKGIYAENSAGHSRTRKAG
jgi:hypothetical protein